MCYKKKLYANKCILNAEIDKFFTKKKRKIRKEVKRNEAKLMNSCQSK